MYLDYAVTYLPGLYRERSNERCCSCYEAAGPLGDVVAVLSPTGIARGRCRTRLPEETSHHVYDRN